MRKMARVRKTTKMVMLEAGMMVMVMLTIILMVVIIVMVIRSW